MKRSIFLAVLLACLLFFTAPAFAADFVFNDGDATYYCYYLTNYQGQTIYRMDVSPEGQGLVIYNPAEGCFTFKVFGGASWYSYSQEGYWSGCGSTAYNANAAGGLFETNIYCGEIAPGAEGLSENSNRIK